MNDDVCDCCGGFGPLPYSHTAHDPPHHSWDYCQRCWDWGCEGPGSCFAPLAAEPETDPKRTGVCSGCKGSFLLRRVEGEFVIPKHIPTAELGKALQTTCQGSNEIWVNPDEVTKEDMAYLMRSLGLESEHSPPAPPTAIFADPEEG